MATSKASNRIVRVAFKPEVSASLAKPRNRAKTEQSAKNRAIGNDSAPLKWMPGVNSQEIAKAWSKKPLDFQR